MVVCASYNSSNIYNSILGYLVHQWRILYTRNKRWFFEKPETSATVSKVDEQGVNLTIADNHWIEVDLEIGSTIQLYNKTFC